MAAGEVEVMLVVDGFDVTGMQKLSWSKCWHKGR